MACGLANRKAPVLLGLLEYITVHDFGQSVVIDAKCERVKLPVTYMHRRDAIDTLKKAVKEGMPEDEQKNAEAKLQKVH